MMIEGPLTFAIVRKRGGIPEQPGDGTRIAEVSTCEYDDRHVRPGESVGYAVLGKRGEAESLAADLSLLGDEASAARALRLSNELGELDIADLLRPDRLAVRLAALEQEFRGLSDDLAARHFLRQAPRRAQTSGWGNPWQVTDGD